MPADRRGRRDRRDARPLRPGRAAGPARAARGALHLTTPLAHVAERVAALPLPARVAIDGVTAAGKTTFADALAAQLAPRTVTRVSIDDFHAPPPEREYYPSSFDLDAFAAHVASLDGLVIADGVFLHYPRLRSLWTLSIFLTVDRAVALQRALARDESRLENARERYATRYVPGETRYLDEVDPESLADIVLDTTDLRRPRLHAHARRPS